MECSRSSTLSVWNVNAFSLFFIFSSFSIFFSYYELSDACTAHISKGHSFIFNMLQMNVLFVYVTDQWGWPFQVDCTGRYVVSTLCNRAGNSLEVRLGGRRFIHAEYRDVNRSDYTIIVHMFVTLHFTSWSCLRISFFLAQSRRYAAKSHFRFRQLIYRIWKKSPRSSCKLELMNILFEFFQKQWNIHI